VEGMPMGLPDGPLINILDLPLPSNVLEISAE
jgi:hypothetical protein